MSEFEISHISGSPTDEERSAIVEAVELFLQQQSAPKLPSKWKLAGRSSAVRGSIADRALPDRWRLSYRLAHPRMRPPYLFGRGEAK